jgi:hypothetical protein
MMFRVYTLAGIILILLGTTACSSKARTTTAEVSTPPPVLVDSSTQTSPLPAVKAMAAETVNESTGSPIPGPNIDFDNLEAHSVGGILMLGDSNNKKPVGGAILYLGDTVADTSGQENLVAMDRVSSPRTITNDQGQFVFTDVPAGTYGLILDQISTSYILLQPGSSRAILIEVVEDQPTNLGELLFDELPFGQ